MNILCFGDSNTYGYRPDGLGRFDENVRWTTRLQKQLGNTARVIEEGLCGRTTVFSDELREGRRGLDSIGIIVESHNPIDVFVVMLGTNDCKTRYQASASVIAHGVDQVIEKALLHVSEQRTPEILLISPIHLGVGVGEDGYDQEFNEESVHTSTQLAKEYRKIAKKYDALFLDASKIASPSSTDREHLDETGHANLAQAIYEVLSKE